MIKKIIILIIILLTIPIASAGNNTTTIENPTELYEISNTVTALESGDSNISFSDGYKGYCAEWGEHSAEKGDEFYVHNEVDNHIKVYFVYFYNETIKDKITTQHMIWKFTDNKEFSRFNQTLYTQIVNTAKEIHLNDNGKIKYNSTHYLVYDFKLFKSKFIEYQNYIGIKIYFEKISPVENTIILNTTFEEKTTSNIKYENKQTTIQNTKSTHQNQCKRYNSSTLNNHKTGIDLTLLFISLTTLILRRKIQ